VSKMSSKDKCNQLVNRLLRGRLQGRICHVFVKPQIRELIYSSASLDAFFPVLACVLSCTYMDKPSWLGQLVCACVVNQRSCGVVIARLRSFVRSLLHQLTYLYLTEDREPTSHQVVSNFKLPVRYFCVPYN
jgi:hypothetical protein